MIAAFGRDLQNIFALSAAPAAKKQRTIFISCATGGTQSWKLDADYYLLGFFLPGSAAAGGNAWILSTDGTSTANASTQNVVRADGNILAYSNVLPAGSTHTVMGLRILLPKNSRIYFSNSYGMALYVTIYLEEA